MIIFGQGVFGEGVFGGPSLGVEISETVVLSSTGYAAQLGLDVTTGDLAFPARVYKGDEAIAQKLRQRLRFFKGEWFLDVRLGIPYIEQIFVKNPQIPAINSIFRKVVLGTPGIVSLDSLSVDYDKRTREGELNFIGRLDDKRTIEARREAFIV